MSLINTFRVLDRSIPVATWKRGEVIELRHGDTLVQNQNGPYVFNGKVLNLSKDIMDKLVSKQRVVRA